jgi:RNA polymerase sigma-70 factor (ECF subfamily)
MVVLDRAVARLREEQLLAGKEALAEALMPFVTAGETAETYAGLAALHATTEAAVKMTVQRLRRRLRELLRAVVAETLERPEDAEEELRALVAALRG